MKIYLLTQNENSGYDTYDSCIVIAKNVYDARRIHPTRSIDNIFYDENKKSFWSNHFGSEELYLFESYDYGSWTNDIEKIEVEYIGEAKKGSKKGVVIASFNAG